MRSLFSALGVAGLLVMGLVGTTWGTSHLNVSQGSSNRLIYAGDTLTPVQAASILAALDSAGSMDEAKTTQLVRQLLPKQGVKADTFKKIIVRPWNASKNTKTIILLSDPADEKQALAANEPAAPASKPAKTDK